MAFEGTGKSGEDASLARVLDLRMRGEIAAIEAVTDEVSASLTQLDVPEEKGMEIILALQEALANAVTHGAQNDGSKEIRCEVQRDTQGRILIIVTDPGPGFSRDSVADPKQAENLYGGHGRGVFLIHELMDEVTFARGGSEIRMWKY